MRGCISRYTLCLLVIAIGASIGRASLPTGANVWYSDFRKAEADSKRLGRPLLVHVHASWCGPCRRMDTEVLHTSAVRTQLETGFIGVMVDGDAHPELCERFQIRAYPSDVFVSPDGRVLARNEGYRDRRSYTSLLAGVDADFQRSEKFHVAKSSIAPGATPPNADVLNGNPIESEDEVKYPGRSDSVEAPEPVLALNGYCPVTIRSERKWVKGSIEFSEEFKGQIFHFVSDREQSLFKENPELYAPRLLGCDPVVLYESDRAVAGSVQYGAFFDGELFLFASNESRQRFKDSPTRFTRTRHVLLPEAIEATRWR